MCASVCVCVCASVCAFLNAGKLVGLSLGFTSLSFSSNAISMTPIMHGHVHFSWLACSLTSTMFCLYSLQ